MYARIQAALFIDIVLKLTKVNNIKMLKQLTVVQLSVFKLKHCKQFCLLVNSWFTNVTIMRAIQRVHCTVTFCATKQPVGNLLTKKPMSMLVATRYLKVVLRNYERTITNRHS